MTTVPFVFAAIAGKNKSKFGSAMVPDSSSTLSDARTGSHRIATRLLNSVLCTAYEHSRNPVNLRAKAGFVCL